MNDRLNKYFADYATEYMFLELMPDYVKRMRIDFMRGVPLPVRKSYVKDISKSTEGDFDFNVFTLGMVSMIGIDPEFKYASKYVKLLTYINEDISKVIVSVGIELAKAGHLDMACINFRAALVIDPNDIDALYNYMLACRDIYGKSSDKEFVTDLKTEVYESLLRLKEMDPSIAMVHYYLGFAYLNMGRYSLAQNAWMDFMKLADEGEEREEIEEKLNEISDAVRIEGAYSDVINGKWEQGLEVLEEYAKTRFMVWWPLPYYLGVGYNRVGRHEEAVEMLKKAFRENPSSPEIAAELVIAYSSMGDEVNSEKYRRKIDILNTPLEEE